MKCVMDLPPTESEPSSVFECEVDVMGKAFSSDTESTTSLTTSCCLDTGEQHHKNSKLRAAHQ